MGYGIGKRCNEGQGKEVSRVKEVTMGSKTGAFDTQSLKKGQGDTIKVYKKK